MVSGNAKSDLIELLQAGIKAVQGEHAVRHALASEPERRFDAVLAIGKAAASMYLGAKGHLAPGAKALVITKHGHAAELPRSVENLEIIESSHPVPAADSLYAGERAMEFVQACGKGADLLVLISGGASALVEVLLDGYDLSDLEAITKGLLANGADIATINQRRKSLSKIKDGRLLGLFPGKSMLTLAISDVSGDGIGVIGSGIGACANASTAYELQIVASNATARRAVTAHAERAGYAVVEDCEELYGDVQVAADRIIASVANGPEGLYLFGGEPTVELPSDPGEGGRNQALALYLAARIAGKDDILCLVAGTDGSDGPTDAAGAIVDGTSFAKQPGGADALSRADAGRFLRETGDRLVTGPTGTNVMDLAIILKGARN